MARFVNGPSQWNVTLQCVVITHWLSAYTEWSLKGCYLRYVKMCSHASIFRVLVTVPLCVLFERSACRGHRPGCSGHVKYTENETYHDDVIKWKHFPRYWSFVQGIHRSPVNSLHKGQWRGALMFYLIWTWTNGWVNNRETGDLIRHRVHYDVTVTDSACYSNKLSPSKLEF